MCNCALRGVFKNVHSSIVQTSTCRMVNKLWFIHAMECYIFMQTNRLHLPVTMWTFKYNIEWNKPDILSVHIYIFRGGREDYLGIMDIAALGSEYIGLFPSFFFSNFMTLEGCLPSCICFLISTMEMIIVTAS